MCGHFGTFDKLIAAVPTPWASLYPRPRPPVGLDYLKVFWPKISTFRNWLLVEAAEDTKRIEQP